MIGYLYAKTLGLPMAILDKRRNDDSESPIMENIIGDVKGKKALIFDDEVASGGSLIEAAELLEKNGAVDITAFCVHGVLSANSKKKILDSNIRKLVVTDTIFIGEEKRHEKLEVVSVAELFSSAIVFTTSGRSISGLYSRF